MTYKDILKDFYATNDFAQLGKNIYLYSSLNRWAETSPAIFLVSEVVNRKFKNNMIHPDELIKVLHCFGFPELDDFEKFRVSIDGSVFKTDQFMGMIDPSFPEIGETVEVFGSHALRQYFIDADFTLPPCLFPGTWLPFVPVDPSMHLPSNAEIPKIVKACPSDVETYMLEKRDCDDFTRIFLGWLSRKGRGNLAFGWLHGNFNYESGKVIFHAICWAISKEGDVWLFDPQDDSHIWKHGEPIAIPGVISMETKYMGI